MATTEIINLTDDLDSRISNGVETVVFYDPETGDKLEIELGEANRKHLASHIEKLEKYVAVARVVTAPAKAKPAAKSDSEISKIRVWAQSHGYAVGDRGRIAQDIKDAYAVAMNAIANPDTDAQASGDEPVKAPESEPNAVSEATGSVALDSATQTVGEAQEIAKSVAAIEANDTETLSDDDILAMMAEIEAEGKVVELDDIKAKLDNE